MRSAAIGVNLVKAVLEKSLVRAQNRFNLSNPQSASKGKRLKERISERKLQRKLQRITREKRLLLSSTTGDTEEIDWRELVRNPVEFELVPDDYSSFIGELKAKCKCLNSQVSFESLVKTNQKTQDPSDSTSLAKSTPVLTKLKKEIKKGGAKKLRKLKNLFRKEKEKLKSNPHSVVKDDRSLSPIEVSEPKLLPKLEILRQQRLKIRKLKKEIKKQARERKVEEEKYQKLELKQDLRKKKKIMKDLELTTNGEISSSSTTTSVISTDVVDSGSISKVSSSSRQGLPTTTITAKVTLISNGGSPKKSTPEPSIPQPKTVLFSRDKVQSGWTQKYPVGSGFVNLGNSCYMNATLQALFHVPSFVHWLLTDETHRRKCQNSQRYEQCMICSMANTLRESMNQNAVIRPMQVYTKLRVISKNFVHGRQEDAHEFLRYLLEAMENSYVRAIGIPQLDTRSKETTPLGQIFGGYLRTEVTCIKCQFVSTTFQPLAELQLDIRHVTAVEDAISHHFRKEKVDNNDYKCEGCRTTTPVIKQFSLELPPIVLCLQLKRFTLYGGKLSKPVHCNRTLDLTKFLHKSLRAKNHPEIKYKLVGLITHIGSSPNGGHYTAIAEASNGNMYQFDDAFVRTVSPQMALNTDAYVIIYEMVNNQVKKETNSSSTSPLSSPNGPKKFVFNNSFTNKPSSTVTSGSLKNIENPITSGTPKSKLIGYQNGVTTSTEKKYENPFATGKISLKNPISLTTTSPSSNKQNIPITPAKSTITSVNGNSAILSPYVKPRTERVPISFVLKSPGEEKLVQKSPIVGSSLGTLKNSIVQRKKSPSPKKTNGIFPTPPESPDKTRSLVPYANEDEEEEGSGTGTGTGTSRVPINRERSSTPKKFDGNISNQPIKSWNGTDSLLSRTSDFSRKRQYEKTETDLLNEEIDAGKVKKQKRSPSVEHRQNLNMEKINKFQSYEEIRRKALEASLKADLSNSKSSPNSNSQRFKDSNRSHHHNSSNGSSHNNNRTHHYSHPYPQSSNETHSHNNHNRESYLQRKSGYNQGMSRYTSQGSNYNNNRFYNRGHHNGGGGGGGSWRGNNRYFNSDNGNNRSYNYHRR